MGYITRTLEIFAENDFEIQTKFLVLVMPLARLQLFIPPFAALVDEDSTVFGTIEKNVSIDYRLADDVSNGTHWNDGLTHFCNTYSDEKAVSMANEHGRLLARCGLSPGL